MAETGVVHQVAVIGTGVIGASWVSCFLANGLNVSATDPAPNAERNLRRAVEAHWPVLESLGLAPNSSPGRLRFDPTIERAARDAQFVQENGPERLETKIETFRVLDRVTGAETILASSSSGLMVSQYQTACEHPERVVLGHPFNPPHLIPLVEVGGGARTSAESLNRAFDFYTAIGKRPIRVQKEMKGHIANRLQTALWREAFYLVQSGVATVADIDLTISHGPGLRWALLGPFLNLELSGGEGGISHNLTHMGPAIEDWWNDLGSVSLTPDLIATFAAGVKEELGDRNIKNVAAERDALLLELLRNKAKSKQLP